MATVTQERERLEALMMTVPIGEDGLGTLALLDRYADPNEPLTSDQVPGFFVSRAGRAEHSKDGDDRFTSRRWLIWIAAAEIEDDTIGSKQDADEAAEGLLDTVLDFLFKYPNLELSGVALPHTQGITVRDDGVKEYQRSTKRYSALPILVDIASYRNPWSTNDG